MERKQKQNKQKLCLHYGEGVVNIANDSSEWYAEYIPTSYKVKYQEGCYV